MLGALYLKPIASKSEGCEVITRNIAGVAEKQLKGQSEKREKLRA